jgi:hypothetical protein
MSDDNALAPLKKFVYPFPGTDASNPNDPRTAEVDDPQVYYDALARAEDGFYPIGYNGQWHGGIHFGSQTGTSLAQDGGVKCIADGEVIAWKLDDDYPTVDYASCGPATYATGFTLVRHRLQLPEGANGQAGNGTPEAAATGQSETEAQEAPSLLFYSLYIHLLNWKGYQQSRDTPRPTYWGDPWHVVGERARDANRTNNPHIPENGIGLNLRDANRQIVGFAPRGTRLKLGTRLGTTGYYEVTESTGTVYPQGLTGAYAYKAELPDTEVEPAEVDTIVIPDAPVGIQAGELIGHLGQYQRYIDMNPLGTACSERPLMQVEVFTTDDIAAFVEQSRERAAQLEDRHKTLLLIEEGARLVRAEGTPDGAALAAQAGSPDGPTAAHARVIPVKALGEAVTEADGTRWWQVEVGTEDGNGASGWVREKDHANVRLCTPWDWPGFEIVDVDGATPRAHYAHHVVQQGHMTPDEQGQLEAEGAGVDSGVLFRKLYDVIDLDGDKALTPLELRQALRKPWLAQALSHLIIKHESEWSGPMDKWHAMDDLIPEQRRQDWEKEKERIESLLWWNDVKGNHNLLDDLPLISHNFHPVGLISNFLRGGSEFVTYRIYQNGLIEKIAPSQETEESTRNACYIYIDAQGNEHDFGMFEGVEAIRWARKNHRGTEAIYLMDASDLGTNPARRFGFRFTETDRRYLSQPALASLIGTLMDVGYEDVASTGFSMRDGSPGVSSSHINGENGDFRFLRTDGSTTTPTHLNTTAGVNALDEARQGAFNNALYKFGWTTQLAWRYTKDGEERLLPRTTHYAGHHHHLHVGRYSPNIVDIEQ